MIAFCRCEPPLIPLTGSTVGGPLLTPFLDDEGCALPRAVSDVRQITSISDIFESLNKPVTGAVAEDRRIEVQVTRFVADADDLTDNSACTWAASVEGESFLTLITASGIVADTSGRQVSHSYVSHSYVPRM